MPHSTRGTCTLLKNTDLAVHGSPGFFPFLSSSINTASMLTDFLLHWLLQSRSCGPLAWAPNSEFVYAHYQNSTGHLQNCNLLRPLIKILCLLVPSGYIILKIKRIPKDMTEKRGPYLDPFAENWGPTGSPQSAGIPQLSALGAVSVLRRFCKDPCKLLS